MEIEERYYRELDPVKRKNILDELFNSRESLQKSEIQKEIFELRYQIPKKGRQVEYADTFVGFWIGMQIYQDAVKRPYKRRYAKKRIQNELQKIHYEELDEKSQMHHELFYREMRQLVKLYIESCKKDNMYNKTMFGLMSMSDKKVSDKLKGDLRMIAVELPQALDMDKELETFIQAVKDEYYVCFGKELQ